MAQVGYCECAIPSLKWFHALLLNQCLVLEMNKKVFAIFSVLIVLGLQFSSVNAAGELKTAKSSQTYLASDDEEFEQDVYNAGEDFYIWTTTITKVA